MNKYDTNFKEDSKNFVVFLETRSLKSTNSNLKGNREKNVAPHSTKTSE